MVYKISWLERKTTFTGKQKADATLQDSNGQTYDKVTIWSTFPDFSNLAAGRDVEGDILVSQNGKWNNKTLVEDKTKSSPSGSFTPNKGMSSGISKLMDKKAENIEKAQDRKHESIAYFNSLNTAIQFVSTFKDMFEINSAGDALDEVLHARDKFLVEWQKYEVGDKTDKSLPF